MLTLTVSVSRSLCRCFQFDISNGKESRLIRAALLESKSGYTMAMKINRAIFWIGLSLYVLSFFLISTTGPGAPPSRGIARGYADAWVSPLVPWVFIEQWSQGILPILMPAILIVGLINPIFIATVIVLLKRLRRPFATLRIIVLLMFPFCGVPFIFGFRPREGFAVWIIGMLLVLFSNRRDQPSTSIPLWKTPHTQGTPYTFRGTDEDQSLKLRPAGPHR